MRREGLFPPPSVTRPLGAASEHSPHPSIDRASQPSFVGPTDSLKLCSTLLFHSLFYFIFFHAENAENPGGCRWLTEPGCCFNPQLGSMRGAVTFFKVSCSLASQQEFLGKNEINKKTEAPQRLLKASSSSSS